MNEITATEITERDNLAVVYLVEKLEQIPNKDRIELVHLKDCGYTTVCEKGHQVGDMVVFVKYDSIVPDNELFAFMKENKFRVKAKSFTIRDEEDEIVDRIYSQGIVLPIKKVTAHLDNILSWDLKEGNDITSELEIRKYIPPTQGSGSHLGIMCSKGDFPTHLVSKTDEINLASKIKALDELQGKQVYITQKIEGSSLTITWDIENDELMVCSRNNQLAFRETNKFWIAVTQSEIEYVLKNNPHIVLQAELYGEGIQKNKLGIQGVNFAVFNVSDKFTRKRFNYYETCEFYIKYKIPMVPVICEINNFDWNFDKLQKYSDIQKYTNGEIAEGIVVRPYEPFHSKILKDLWSVKVVNRDYKL